MWDETILGGAHIKKSAERVTSQMKGVSPELIGFTSTGSKSLVWRVVSDTVSLGINLVACSRGAHHLMELLDMT